MRRRQEPHPARARGGHPVGHARGGVRPGGRDLLAGVVPDQRPGEPGIPLDPVVLETPDVAHPVPVDVGVVPRRHADQPRALGPLRLCPQPERDVAALRTGRADGIHGLRIVPGAALEAIVPRRDCADRADVHQVAREQRVHAVLLEGRDLAAVAAIDDADLGVTVDLAHEANAPCTKDAAIAVQHQGGAEIDVRFDTIAVEHAAGKIRPALGSPEGVREVLQRALAPLVAHGAIQRVVEEQKLEHRGSRLHDLWRPRVNHHPVGAHRGTRGLQLGHLFDLDDADAAGSVNAQARVEAVIGQVDAVLDGRLQHGAPLLNRDRLAVEGNGDRLHRRGS